MIVTKYMFVVPIPRCLLILSNAMSVFNYGWMKRKKMIKTSILIINLLFEIFINSLSETVKALYFCLHRGKSVRARIFNLVSVFT